MEIDIGANNVPFHVDNSILLTDRDLKNWKKVPWAFYSKDERPDERKEKITSLGRLRFLEGWLYDNLSEPGTVHKERYWAQEFDTWFSEMKKEGIMTDTRECEGCIGSFWKLASEDDVYNAFPGYWVYEGEWWRVYTADNCRKSGAPPSLCTFRDQPTRRTRDTSWCINLSAFTIFKAVVHPKISLRGFLLLEEQQICWMQPNQQ